MAPGYKRSIISGESGEDVDTRMYLDLGSSYQSGDPQRYSWIDNPSEDRYCGHMTLRTPIMRGTITWRSVASLG